MSSAYWIWLTPWEVIILASGTTYRINSIGTRTDPWGPPFLPSKIDDCFWPTRTFTEELPVGCNSSSMNLLNGRDSMQWLSMVKNKVDTHRSDTKGATSTAMLSDAAVDRVTTFKLLGVHVSGGLYKCLWWFFLCYCDLHVWIVFESRLTFNNQFY